jgi:hypothetical protein
MPTRLRHVLRVHLHLNLAITSELRGTASISNGEKVPTRPPPVRVQFGLEGYRAVATEILLNLYYTKYNV